MIFLWVDIRDAVKSISRRPLRSFLSSLGIGIGVTALITMLSISEGAKRKALAKIQSLGTNTLRIEAVTESSGSSGSRINLSQGLLLEDGERIATWIGKRGWVGYYIKKESAPVRIGNMSITATVLGVSDGWFRAEKVVKADGRFLGKADINRSDNFCVLGSKIGTVFRSRSDNSGRPVHIGSIASTVVGSLKPKGRLLTEGTGLSSLDFDKTVILPISVSPYGRMIADRRAIDGIVVSLTGESGKNVNWVAEQLTEILSRRHRSVEDFTVVIPFALLKEAKENQRVFSIVMGIIAGLSLVVGGIGIMNVMLANIAEQTREIGLRMAVGASKARIVRLFLLNSVVLTLLGSLWGIFVGIALALVVQRVAGWEIVLSAFSIVIAPLSAIFAGIVFGSHPALRAASLDPAHALRDT